MVKLTKLNLGQYSEARFGQDFEVEAQASFLSWSLVIILSLMFCTGYEIESFFENPKVGLDNILNFKFCRDADVWLRF